MKAKPIFIEPNVRPFDEDDVANAHIEHKKIHTKVKKGQNLLESEKNYFCQYLRIFAPAIQMESCSVCSNFRFKNTYIMYWWDLTGGSKYYKPHIESSDLVKLGIETILKTPNEFKRDVSIEEAQMDIRYLRDAAQNWEKELQNSRAGDKSWCISKETEYHFSQLDDEPEFKYDPYIKATHRYRYARLSILLQSKYVYVKTQEVIQSIQEQDLFFLLNGQEIQLTECAICHILSRHYAASARPYISSKSYHNGDFHHEQIPLQLNSIITTINTSGVYINDSTKRISFKYKGVSYCLRTGGKFKRQVNGKSQDFTRIQTFYPVERQVELEQLLNDYTCIPVNDEIEVYCKK